MADYITNIHEVLKELSPSDQAYVDEMEALYDKVLLITANYDDNNTKEKDKLTELYLQIGQRLHAIVDTIPRLNVYSFSQPQVTQRQTSRLISKLRDVKTQNVEFTYYMQKAFELLFDFGFQENIQAQRNYFAIQTPVDIPVQNYAIHKLPNLDEHLHNTVMCVMLRGALLPSMILAKEIEEYSSIGYVPDFALFRISRNDDKDATNMEYLLKEWSSYYDIESLNGKDLLFPDPMNATGGSILTVLKYFREHNVKPRSIKVFHAISSLQGALQIVRAQDSIELYTLWVDPILNEKAYIMPGLGDAGDRLNGIDGMDAPRNVMQLIAYYGQNILQLYRSQIQKIEETILGKV